jgi:hypothetical protein
MPYGGGLQGVLIDNGLKLRDEKQKVRGVEGSRGRTRARNSKPPLWAIAEYDPKRIILWFH